LKEKIYEDIRFMKKLCQVKHN